MTVRRAVAIATTAVVLGGAGAGSADAQILLQHGIGGVRLGQTSAKVTKVKGPPVSIVKGVNEFGRFMEFRYRGLTVSFQGGDRVTAVSTRSRAERTNRGIGYGSTTAQLLARHPKATCPDTLHCVVGVEEPGRTVTSFTVRKGIVRRVVVGYVID